MTLLCRPAGVSRRTLLCELPTRFCELPTPVADERRPARSCLGYAQGCVRMTAVAVLGDLPEEDLLPLLPRLMQCLDDDFWRVRRHVTEVIIRVPATALAAHADAVLSRLQHTDGRVREWAVATFGRLSAVLEPSAASAIAPRAAELLQPLLEDDDRRVRERAAALCARISAAGGAPSDGITEG